MNEDIKCVQTFSEELTIKATERIDDFMFEVMQPYCEKVSKHFITKKDLENALSQYFDKSESEDAISRAELKLRLQEHHDFFVNAYGGFSNLPPKEKARVDEITNCIAEVMNMPSVQTIRPKGEWIPQCQHRYRECSICNTYFMWDMPRNSFCPNCGADMRGNDNG